jgi:hypothetical protein
MSGMTTTLSTIAAAFALLTLGTAGPAAAANGGATVSLDGESFSAAPAGSVFPAGLVLVPGSQHTGTVWVRNDSDRPAALRISATDTTASNAAFIENLTLRAVTPATDDSDAVTLQHGATCTPLLEGELMPPQSVTEVTITLAMRDSVDNAHQGATADTTLMVSLSDPDAPGTAADCMPGGGIPLTPSPAPDPDDSEDSDDSGNTADPDDPDDADAADAPDAPDAPDGQSTSSGGGGAGGDAEPGDGSSGTGGSETSEPTAETPVGAAAPSSLAGSSPVLFPWMGLGAVVLAGGVIFGIRQRKGQRR